MSGPSAKAIEFAEAAMTEHFHGPWGGHVSLTLNAAHSPKLGLDRSICLRDVIEWLRTDDGPTMPDHETANSIEREFGGKQ